MLVFPGIRISTAEAYRWVRPRSEGRPDLERLLRDLDPVRWRRELVNDFEAPVLDRHPMLRALRDRLYALGALYAALSGSGSAFWAIFETEPSARAALEALSPLEAKLSPPRPFFPCLG